MQANRHLWRPGFAALLLAVGSVLANDPGGAAALAPALQEPLSLDLGTGVESDEELALKRRSETLLALMEEAPGSLEASWPEARACLDLWEASTQLEEAARQYMALLLAVVEVLRGEDAVSFEAEVRTYLNRAATLAETDWERALFRLGVAESLLRDPSTRTEAERADALLREVLETLPERAPKEVAYALRCRQFLNADGGQWLNPGASPTGLTLSEAVRLLRALLGVGEGNPEIKDQASRVLEFLSREQVHVERTARFATFEAIRLPVETRNVETLRCTVTPLSRPGEPVPPSRAQLDAMPLEELIPVFQETLVFGGDRSDWATGFIEIEEGLPAGWYALEVSGRTSTERGLLLISDLEVIAFPHSDGWEVRVFKWPPAEPMAGARVAFYTAEGALFAEKMSDAEGRVIVLTGERESLTEVAVLAGDQPAVLPLVLGGDEIHPEPLQVVAYPRVVRSGQPMSWFAMGEGSEATRARFRTPGGAVLFGEVLQVGAGWVSGELRVAVDDWTAGPLYFEQPDGTWAHVAHLEQAIPSNLEVRPIGKPLYPGFGIYAVSEFAGLEVQPLASAEPFPDYVRVEVRAIRRGLRLEADGVPPTPSGPVYQEVVNLSSAGPVRLSLAGWPRPAEWTAVLATVHPLGSSRELGRTLFALAAERETLLVSGKERLVRLGEALELLIERPWGNGEALGDLVVYRETWQSRYIHRKRGTFISETAYMALPERSLLGSAKTDYELFEEGFVREEAERIEVALEGPRQEVSLQFSRAGYYRIEWEAESGEVAVAYPEGPVEVWVIPPDGDLKPFRAKQPRLVLERSGPEQAEVLLLMDRPRRSVLLRWGSGADAQVRVVNTGDAAAVYVDLPAPPESVETPLEAVVIGERISGRLEAVLFERRAGPDWELEAGRRIGLRPGSVMDWEVRVREKNLPLWWTFEKALPFPETLDYADRAAPDSGGELRALSRMFSVGSSRPERSGPRTLAFPEMVPHTPRAVMALYPELDLGADPPPFTPQILDQQSPFPMPRALKAALPEEAGSWNLVVFGVEEGQLETMRWRISTELPVQIAIEGPERLRLGDRAVFDMRLRNSLPNALNLTCEVRFPEAIRMERVAPRFLQLPPLRTVSIELPVAVTLKGEGVVAVRLENEDVETEEVRRLVALEPAMRPRWRGVFGAARGEPVEFSLRMGSDIPGFATLAPGVGSLLSPLWTLMREEVRVDDTLLLALGDWAVSAALTYHGATPLLSLDAASSALAAALVSHSVPSGGWSYLPGGSASLSLSCQLVACLEMGAANGDPVLLQQLAAGRAYLERQLLSTGQPVQTRLQVLRTVSLSAAYGQERGPTRLEARHFLDLFQKREDLTLVQLALLLQTAANFAFDEEVRLLGDALLARYDASERPLEMSLSQMGLLYGILTRDLAGGERADAVLRELLHGLSDESPVTGWEPVAALFSLANDYYWSGDFEVEGRYAFALDEALTDVELGSSLAEATVTVPLAQNPGQAGGPSLRLDASQLSVRLFALVQGSDHQTQEYAEHPLSESVTRRYYEERTLLRGSRAKTALLAGSASIVNQQDDLVREIRLRGLPPAAPVEVEVALPAGLIPSNEAIQVEHLLDGRQEAWLNWRVEVDEAAHLIRLVACTPEEGDLRVTVRLRARWAGDYRWPAPVLIDRLAGTCHRLGEAVRLQIMPADLSAPVGE